MDKEFVVEQTLASYAEALGVTVEYLKSQKVTLAEIVNVQYDAEALKAFSSARSVFRTTCFYIVKSLLKK